jgi:DNA mismatch endonuclease (patch repair protein)
MRVSQISREGRSRIMSAIRKVNTKPELIVRRFLHAYGLRYRLHAKELPGSPDIVFPRQRAVVLVHGCFWHRCPHCPAGRKVVRSNIDYWHPKLERNVARDARVRKQLEEQQWRVLTIWECQTTDMRLLTKIAMKLIAWRSAFTGSRACPTRRRHRAKLRRPLTARG